MAQVLLATPDRPAGLCGPAHRAARGHDLTGRVSPGTEGWTLNIFSSRFGPLNALEQELQAVECCNTRENLDH